MQTLGGQTKSIMVFSEVAYRRGGKREGAVRMKSPALAKITREIDKKHGKANHQYIYLENRVFSTWRKVRAEGTFVNDSNFALWQMAVRFVAPYVDVNSDQCRFFKIYLGQSSIFILERNVLNIS